MLIEIWSDLICPWCYIGSTNLTTALDQFARRSEVTIKWRAFQLHPRAPAEPTDLRVGLARAYGISAEQVERMLTRVQRAGNETGIRFNFDLVGPSNTFDAHRLIAAAADHATALSLALFSAYFERGAVLSDHEQLLKIWTQTGLDPVVAIGVLNTDRFVTEVREDLKVGRATGVAGVPLLRINQHLDLGGAQSVERYLKMLDHLAPGEPDNPPS